MKADFSRNTFNAGHHVTRVLMQQGRPLLDADWNEQVDVLLHHLRVLTRDLFGDVPVAAGGGFALSGNAGALMVAPGRCYVGGILCENDADLDFATQPWLDDAQDLESGQTCLVYLDVWERDVTYLEQSWMREVALGGADSAARTEVVWQVKTVATKLADTNAAEADWTAAWTAARTALEPANRGLLRAGLQEPDVPPPSPNGGGVYEGLENQLYRVEVHRGGAAFTGANRKTCATFKWSRDNGTVAFRVRPDVVGASVFLDGWWRDDRQAIAQGDVVELIEDYDVLRNEPGQLHRVVDVDPSTFRVELDPAPKLPHEGLALLRLWNQRPDDDDTASDGVSLPIEEGNDVEIKLENGIVVQFAPSPKGNEATYRSGDYWIVPARTATRSLEWPADPKNAGKPLAVAPQGIQHEYALLGLAQTVNNKVEAKTLIPFINAAGMRTAR